MLDGFGIIAFRQGQPAQFGALGGIFTFGLARPGCDFDVLVGWKAHSEQVGNLLEAGIHGFNSTPFEVPSALDRILGYSNAVNSKRSLLDKIGAYSGAICAVHCILTGVALGLLSSLGFGFFGSIWVDLGFVLIAVIVGAVALRHGIVRHGSYRPALFYVAGLLAILLAHFEDFSHGMPIHVEHRHNTLTVALSVLGGACFVMFHVMNLRLGNRCQCGHSGRPSENAPNPS